MPNIFTGTVTKTGAMAKTITVTISRRFEHPKYLKELERTKKILVHDELGEAKLGDRVQITHTRPLSSSKHFYLSSINQRHTENGVTSIPVQAGPPPPPKSKLLREARKRRTSDPNAVGEQGNGKGGGVDVLEALSAQYGEAAGAR